MPEIDLHQHVDAVRRFNRFYTRQIGVLQEGMLKSPFSLTEARMIYELAQQEQTTATALNANLGLDAGYLSRLLSAFEKRGLIGKKPSDADGRKNILWLTEEGQKVATVLNKGADDEIEAMLNNLPASEQSRLVGAMCAIERLLGASPEQKAPYLLRPHRPGDMGWITWRHGVLYAEEYGWDEHFEALVANIAAEFIQQYDPKRERCWIAERDGENVGSVFLVKKSETVAKLRLLLVEPKARGLGIGTRLINECIRFARQAGYRKITLWTNSILTAARHLYKKAGFRLIHEEPHRGFGPDRKETSRDMKEETWELTL